MTQQSMNENGFSGPAKVNVRLFRHRVGSVAAAALLLALAACGPEEQADRQPPPRPVGVAVVERIAVTSTIQLTGDIQAEKEIGASFRLAGRIIESKLAVGDRVEEGQVLARLDAQTETNDLNVAKAAREAAIGEVAKTRSVFERQEGLMAQGFTTRPRFDQAQAALEAAMAQLETAEAQVQAATDRLGFTELRAAAPGVVTAKPVESGEVVQAGQIVLRLARDEARDAVFDVPAAMLANGQGQDRLRISVVATNDPTATAEGFVREISPQADPVTRTFRVRVGLEKTPEALRLGTPVIGRATMTAAEVVSIPAGALTMSGSAPAVWVVDPTTMAVSLRIVEVLRFEVSTVLVAQGLEVGEIVVSAGIQALHPGQKIEPPGGKLPVQAAAAPQIRADLTPMQDPAAALGHAPTRTMNEETEG